MGAGNRNGPQKITVGFKALPKLIQAFRLEAFVFFLKYSRVFPLFVGLAIVTVFGHLVDEKERENLHALGKKGLFFFQMGLDRLPDLDAPHGHFGNVAGGIARAQHLAVCELHRVCGGVNLGNHKATILLKLV